MQAAFLSSPEHVRDLIPADAPWRRDSAAAAAAAAAAHGAQLQPPQPQPAAEWPDAHGDLVTSEDGAEKPPMYKAFAFNDAERADLAAAGGIGMLGYRFHRRTTVNWWGALKVNLENLNLNPIWGVDIML